MKRLFTFNVVWGDATGVEDQTPESITLTGTEDALTEPAAREALTREYVGMASFLRVGDLLTCGEPEKDELDGQVIFYRDVDGWLYIKSSMGMVPAFNTNVAPQKLVQLPGRYLRWSVSPLIEDDMDKGKAVDWEELKAKSRFVDQ